MDFEEFCKIVRDRIANGVIKISEELTDLDLAITYAIGKEMDERGGGPMTVTPDEIFFLIGKHCGKDVRKRVLPD